MRSAPAIANPALRDLLPADLWHGVRRPPTVEELTALLRELTHRHRERWTMTQAGRSRAGEPLHLVTVPGGPLRVLVVGGPHPHEHIGLAVLDGLGRLLSQHPEASAHVSWYLMPCLDPDGARLNTWTQQNGEPTLESYHRGFFRPARTDQPEWALPQPGTAAQLPEAAALAHVIDTVRPHVYLSLHGADTGGTFLLTSQADPALVPLLHQASARYELPVEEHPSDALDWPSVGPGVFVLPPPDQFRSSGASSVHYAHRRGARYALMPEMPMWTSSPHDLPAARAAEHLEQAVTFLTTITQQFPLPPDSPFTPAVTDTLAIMDTMARSYRSHPHAGAGQDLAHLTPLRACGMLLRALDALPERRNSPLTNVRLGALRQETETRCDQWLQAAEEALRPSPLPLSRTAGFQLDTILSVTDLLVR
ncbi:M14 family zinc carboxypeptidase [Streptomyces sp. NPDC051561]|uniref:M14 family zinc carboxypeptidase n=1 Tax=Streptomyces sp. NPDC051561 TaxID=3365658 RepID=UPI0037BD887A